MKKYLIWSIEHGAWWKPNSNGYTYDREKAGRYTLEESETICADANHYVSKSGRDWPNEAIVPE